MRRNFYAPEVRSAGRSVLGLTSQGRVAVSLGALPACWDMVFVRNLCRCYRKGWRTASDVRGLGGSGLSCVDGAGYVIPSNVPRDAMRCDDVK